MMGWEKYGEGEKCYDPKTNILTVKHGGGSVIAWVFMAASGTELLVYTWLLIEIGRRK